MHPYLVEGIGKESWPDTLDRVVVDRWVTVGDRDSFLTARRITAEEGVLVGGSAGTAMWAALEVAKDLSEDHLMVVILPDSGKSYLSKLYDESWMLEHGFLERPGTQARIGEVLAEKRRLSPAMPDLVAVPSQREGGPRDRHPCGVRDLAATGRPERQARRCREIVGSIQDRTLLDRVFRDRDALVREVAEVMDAPLAGRADLGRGRGDVRRSRTGGRGDRRRRGFETGRSPVTRRPTGVPRTPVPPPLTALRRGRGRGPRSGRRDVRCRPTAGRDRSGTSMPEPARLACVIRPGCSISDSTPPSDSPRKNSSVFSQMSRARSSRAGSNDTMPP